MSDDQGASEKLLARAAAAIEEAERLTAENRAWQAEIIYNLRRRSARTTFHPHSLKLCSPRDFPEKKRPDQPVPAESAPRE
jgi:hypothetical protein